jgi:hypothetical protein
LSKIKSLAGEERCLALFDRLTVHVGESGIACGAAPSLRTIFPVKNVFGYCGYSGSDNADRLRIPRSESSRTRAQDSMWLNALRSEQRRACRSAESHSKYWKYDISPRRAHCPCAEKRAERLKENRCVTVARLRHRGSGTRRANSFSFCTVNARNDSYCRREGRISCGNSRWPARGHRPPDARAGAAGCALRCSA